MVPSWLTCVVLPGYFPCKVYLDLNLHETFGMGDACSLLSFHRSAIALWLYEDYGYVNDMTTWESKLIVLKDVD
jgi:hypothetical protein